MEYLELDGVIIDVDYVSTEGRSIIRVTLKSKGKIYTILDPKFYPYFYLVPMNKEIDPAMLSSMNIIVDGEKHEIQSINKHTRNIKGTETTVLKIEAKNTRGIPKLSEYLKEFGNRYEYDILFWKRYLIDNNISPFSGVHVKAHEEGKHFGNG